jgi:hypothetical protein
LIGFFVTTVVGTPVIAALGDFDHSQEATVTVNKEASSELVVAPRRILLLEDLPSELREKILCYLLPGDFLSAMCTSKTMYWTAENCLSSPLKRKKISQSDLLGLLAPIGNSFTEALREGFFSDNFFDRHIETSHFTEVADRFIENPHYVDIFYPDFIDPILNPILRSSAFLGYNANLRSIKSVTLIRQYVNKNYPNFFRDEDINSLTDHEREQIVKFSKFLPPPEKLLWAFHVSDIAFISIVYPKEFNIIVREIQFENIGRNHQITVLEFIQKSQPDEALRIIKGIQFTDFARSDHIKALEFIRECYPDEALRIIKGTHFTDFARSDHIKALEFIRECYPDEALRIIKEVQSIDMSWKMSRFIRRVFKSDEFETIIKGVLPITSPGFCDCWMLEIIQKELPDEFDRIVQNVLDTFWFKRYFPGYEPNLMAGIARLFEGDV